jgi:peroxiredoxin
VQLNESLEQFREQGLEITGISYDSVAIVRHFSALSDFKRVAESVSPEEWIHTTFRGNATSRMKTCLKLRF